MRVLSVNVGGATTVEIKGRHEETSIFKDPVAGPVAIGRFGLEGDARIEKRKLGAEHHAVYAYPLEHYRYWEERLRCPPMPMGQWGENLTIEGWLETEARVGDIVRCGTALLQVGHPRIPCRKLNARLRRRIARTFLESRKVGFYLRVLEEGVVQAGDRLVLEDIDPASPTIDEFVRFAELDYWDPEGLERLLAARDLIPGWREILEDKLKRARDASGWFGFRELQVVRRHEECEGVVSLFLRCPEGRRLAPFLPGQHLTLLVQANPEIPAVRRSYALSGPPSDVEYRITVRRARPLGERSDQPWASGYLHDHIKVGDRMRAAAPAGAFTLAPPADDDDAVVFFAQGIGIAPLSAMLTHLRQERADRSAFAFFLGDRPETTPLLDEVSAATQGGQIRFAPTWADAEGHRLARLLPDLPPLARCDVYVVGSTAYVDDVLAQLAAVEERPRRLCVERFGPVA